MMIRTLMLFAVLATVVVPAFASEAEQETSALEETAEQAPQGQLARSTFTTGVVDREPQDSIEMASNDVDKIYYFNEILGATGDTITHRWTYGDQVMAEVSFEIGGPRWRVYSSKQLLPSWVGEWTVAVIDSAGRTLSEDSFVYTEAATPAEAAVPAAPQP